MLEGFLLGPCIVYSQVLGHFSSVRDGSHLMEWALNPSKKWLVTPVTFVPLLYQHILQAGLCCRLQFVPGWCWYLLFSSGSIPSTFPVPQMLVGRGEASSGNQGLHSSFLQDLNILSFRKVTKVGSKQLKIALGSPWNWVDSLGCSSLKSIIKRKDYWESLSDKSSCKDSEVTSHLEEAETSQTA